MPLHLQNLVVRGLADLIGATVHAKYIRMCAKAEVEPNAHFSGKVS